jgi:hypothetical protein
MAASQRRLAEASWLLEGHAEPSHMLTLTLPKQVWEGLPSNEARLELWTSALDRFLNALRVRLNRRFGVGEWGWLQWLEFQRRGAPHLHVLMDLGGRLPEEDYAEWTAWITWAWSAALGVPAPFATRFEGLRKRDFRYVRAYVFGSKKAPQKALPFPGPWGRTWDVAGKWRKALRYERRRLQQESSTYEINRAALEALIPALEATLPVFTGGKASPAASAFIQGLRGILDLRRSGVRVIVPPPSAGTGDPHPLVLAVMEAAYSVQNPDDPAAIPPAPAPPSSPGAGAGSPSRATAPQGSAGPLTGCPRPYVDARAGAGRYAERGPP